MWTNGSQCRISLEIAGRRLQPLGSWFLEESYADGCVLECKIALEDAPPVSPGMELTLKQSEHGTQPSHRIKLWVTRVEQHHGIRGKTLRVAASDPLRHLADYPCFRSHVGRISLDRLIIDILGTQAPYLATQPDFHAATPTIIRPWLFQANEDGRSFLLRIGRGTGQQLNWNRDHLRCDPIWCAPEMGVTIDLDDLSGVVDWSLIHGLPALAGRGYRIDPDTRAIHTIRFGNSHGGIGVPQRLPSLEELDSSNPQSQNPGHFRGHSIRAKGALFRLRPGSRLRTKDGLEWCIDKANHWFEGSGSYQSQVTAVLAEFWGLRGDTSQDGQLGPYQAEVVCNNDPEGQGRIRVRLCEDPEARPTPYIPILTLSAAREAGTQWLPEVGELVMVAAERQSPEALVALGALRSHDHKVASKWRQRDNRVKTLFGREGFGIVLDDEAGYIALITPKARLEVTCDGRIQATGDECQILGNRLVRLDGRRIELG